MKSTTAILTVKLLGDDQTAKAFKDAQGRAEKFEAGLSKAAGVATGVLVGLAGAGLGAALAAEEVASANAVVANVLGNMGMDKATDRVLEYADALEKSLGIDEKVIKATQGKLGTFSELASSADVAGGAFDRATLAALDMAAAGFGTAEGNAVQLGKALQDPIKGISALQKSGVTFTEEQKNMIEAMMEAGDAAGAQDLILSELEKQVGGTAAANADGSEKIKLAFGEVAEKLGETLLPYLDDLADKVQAFADWASQNIGLIKTVAAVIGSIAAAVVAVNAAFKIYNAIVKITAAVQAVLNFVMAMNPIVLIVLAIMLLIGVLILAYQKSDKFREIVDKVWQVLKGAFKAAIDAVKDALQKAWDMLKKVGDWLKSTWDSAIGAAKDAINKLKDAFNAVKDAVKGVFDWFKKLMDRAGELFDKLNPFKGLSNLFGGKARLTVQGAAPAGRTAGPIIYHRAAGYNPQREAIEIARLLGGATVRTGFRGVRAA